MSDWWFIDKFSIGKPLTKLQSSRIWIHQMKYIGVPFHKFNFLWGSLLPMMSILVLNCKLLDFYRNKNIFRLQIIYVNWNCFKYSTGHCTLFSYFSRTWVILYMLVTSTLTLHIVFSFECLRKQLKSFFKSSAIDIDLNHILMKFNKFILFVISQSCLLTNAPG